MLPKFPSSVTGDGGIQVTKIGGSYVISPTLGVLGDVVGPGASASVAGQLAVFEDGNHITGSGIAYQDLSFEYQDRAANGANGITINSRGAKFRTDNLFAPQGSAFLFRLVGCQRIVFNDPWYVQSAYTTLDETKGGVFLQIADTAAPFSSGIWVNNIEMTGGRIGLYVNPQVLLKDGPNDIHLNGNFDSVYYPLSFQAGGDNFTGDIVCTKAGRSYIGYNVSNHTVKIISDGGGPFNDVQISTFAYPAAATRLHRQVLSDFRWRRL